MSNLKKIAICGVHGTGKSTICTKIQKKIQKQNDIIIQNAADNKSKNCNIIEFRSIPEQFREVVNHILYAKDMIKQTEEITLATYAKQLYLENLYTAQGKNILCDRSVLDTFVYYDYFNPKVRAPFNLAGLVYEENKSPNYSILEDHSIYYIKSYSKIYLIEPSDREIEDDGFRLIDKKQQLEIHKLFLEYFKNLDNVEIINQEEAHEEGFVDKVVSKFDI